MSALTLKQSQVNQIESFYVEKRFALTEKQI